MDEPEIIITVTDGADRLIRRRISYLEWRSAVAPGGLAATVINAMLKEVGAGSSSA